MVVSVCIDSGSIFADTLFRRAAMREPHTELYVHVVWSTWDRLPQLVPALIGPVYACVQAQCRALKADVIAIGGTATHVHLLVRVPATLAIAVLVKQVKGASSHLVTHEYSPLDGFKWQGAYGAFTVSSADVPRICEYIRKQEEHHNPTVPGD
jgi:putative transposase